MGILDKAKAALAVASGERDALREREAALARRISAVDTKIEELRFGPLRLEDFRGYIAKFVQERGKDFGAGFGAGEALPSWGVPERGSGDGAHLSIYKKGLRHFEDEQGNLREGAIVLPSQMTKDKPGQVFDAMCFFCPEAVISKLSEEAATHLAKSNPLSVEERRKHIAQLVQERQSVQTELNGVEESVNELTRMLRT